MKHLKIHKLLWFIIVVAFTFLEGAVFVLYSIVFLVWNFHFPKCLWSEFHSAEHDYENKWGGYSYKDKNILETIIRRYKYTWT